MRIHQMETICYKIVSGQAQKGWRLKATSPTGKA
jgi:hypothetical protein